MFTCVLGLLGSAAARHLATDGAGVGRPSSVVLVGPEETDPAVAPSNAQRSIFAAHLDEGRITRVTDPVSSLDFCGGGGEGTDQNLLRSQNLKG